MLAERCYELHSQQHEYTVFCENSNPNKALRIEQLKPLPCTRKRKGTVKQLSPLLKRIRKQVEVNLGNLERLGTDILCNVLTRLDDVNSLLSCLQVSRALLALITSSRFRQSWRGSNGLLVGSRTFAWYLLASGDPERSSPFWPMNIPDPDLESVQLLASAGGLLCVNLHPTNDDVLELAVGNPLTREWVILPVPDREFPASSRISFRMEVLTGGHFKVSAQERDFGFYRVSVYDSASDSWGVTELHYPPLSFSKWSDYDLSRGCWRTGLIRFSGLKVQTGLVEHHPDEMQELSAPRYQDFIKWEYKKTSYFASLWLTMSDKTFSGYGVWKVDESSGQLVLVSAAWCKSFLPDVEPYGNIYGVKLNNRYDMFISCNAFQNLVCFAGMSPAHPTLPIVFFNLDAPGWYDIEGQPLPFAGEELVCGYACDHISVGLVYSPSLLAPAQKRHGGIERRNVQGTRLINHAQVFFLGYLLTSCQIVSRRKSVVIRLLTRWKTAPHDIYVLLTRRRKSIGVLTSRRKILDNNVITWSVVRRNHQIVSRRKSIVIHLLTRRGTVAHDIYILLTRRKIIGILTGRRKILSNNVIAWSVVRRKMVLTIMTNPRSGVENTSVTRTGMKGGVIAAGVIAAAITETGDVMDAELQLQCPPPC